MLKGKCVVVGVCGGIAAYKTAAVVIGLKKLGAEVHVIMTKKLRRNLSVSSRSRHCRKIL